MTLPVAFIGVNLTTNYLLEYLNTVFVDDIEEPWDESNFIEGYTKFFKDLDIEMGKDIMFIDISSIDAPGRTFDDMSWLVGAPLTNFSVSLSIKRMCMDIYDLLASIDLLVEEPLEIVEFNLFNMEF